MSKWVPDWATHYVMIQLDYACIQIEFHKTPGQPKVAKPISELAKDLAIADVCQQIREKKPATLDEAFAESWNPSRIDVVGQNGNTGEHYEPQRSKYHREIKPGVWVDVYDVLNAFGVKCHALAHAIKKLLMPGERGAKDYKQDCDEAIQSINRSVDEWG
jgi:hypothetical protein